MTVKWPSQSSRLLSTRSTATAATVGEGFEIRRRMMAGGFWVFPVTASSPKSLSKVTMIRCSSTAI